MKKLASIDEMPADEAEVVSAAQSGLAAQSSADGRGGLTPPVLGPVRRVRSRHHRHHRFRMEKIDEIRHREDVRALSFILPLILLVVGLGILGTWFRSPDPMLRPDKLLSVAWVLTALGGGWFVFSSIFGAWRRYKEARKRREEEREDAESDSEFRRRSHHRHHHHYHHHHHSDGSGDAG